MEVAQNYQVIHVTLGEIKMSQILESRIRIDKDPLLKILKSIDSLDIEEAVLVLDEEGLTFRSMDGSHVALLDIIMPNCAFEIWDIKEKTQLAFNVPEFLKLIKTLDSKIPITINLDKDGLIKLSQREAKFVFKRLNIDDSTDCPLPIIDFNTGLMFNGEFTSLDFVKNLKKVNAISDYVTLESTFDWLYLRGKGDNGSVDIPITKDDFELDQRRGTSCTTYSLEYLMAFLKVVDKHTLLRIEYSENKPCRLELTIDNVSKIHFYLAPRVES